MRIKLLAAAVALAALGGASLEALAQAKPDVLVKQRQAAMTLQGKYLGPIGAMMKGAAPYNADIVARNATFLENLSRMPWDGFDASTLGEKSKAKPDVYKEPSKFMAAYELLDTETSKLGAAARATDEPDRRASMRGAVQACRSLH